MLEKDIMIDTKNPQEGIDFFKKYIKTINVRQEWLWMVCRKMKHMNKNIN